MKIQDPITNQNLSLIGQYIDVLPDWVKEASMEPLFDEVPANLFAADGALPCHTKLATFLSRAYFTVQQKQIERNRAEKIEAKLASFERQWRIDPTEVEVVVNQIKVAQAIPTVDELGQQLLNKVAAGSNIQLDHLVVACRELVSQGCTLPRVHKVAMITPVADFKAFIRDLARKHGNEQAKTAAAELLQSSHEAAQQHVAEVLSGINMDPRRFISKIAALPEQEHFDVRIDAGDYPRRTVIQQLPKIAAITGLPVICGDLDVPAANWESIITGCDKVTQRRIQTCVA